MSPLLILLGISLTCLSLAGSALLLALAYQAWRATSSERSTHPAQTQPSTSLSSTSPAYAVPDQVLRYCAAESERWAREELLGRVIALYENEAGQDWDRALQILAYQEEGSGEARTLHLTT
jgi:hypothetical protein